MNALFVPDRKFAAVRLPRGHLERSRVDEAKRTLSAKPQRFRIQFVCAAVDRGAPTLKEAPIEAADVSAGHRHRVEDPLAGADDRPAHPGLRRP